MGFVRGTFQISDEILAQLRKVREDLSTLPSWHPSCGCYAYVERPMRDVTPPKLYLEDMRRAT